MTTPQATFDLIARFLLAAIFVLAGIDKIGNYDGTAAYMSSMGLSAALLPLVIAFEIGAGAALIIGLFTRLSALALAGFSIVSALIFHSNTADPMQFILMMKNFAMAGGLLMLALHGAGPWSLDAKRQASEATA